MEGKVETNSGQRWGIMRLAAWSAGAGMLSTALIARSYLGEVSWVDALAQTGALIIAVGIAYELVSRTSSVAAYRTAIGLTLASFFLLGWVNGAVGLIGSENNAANLMYAGVFLVCVVGTVLARLKPAGMARALLATALAQTLVAVIALVGRLGSSHSGPLEIVTANGFFVALFVGSAALFRKAANGTT